MTMSIKIYNTLTREKENFEPLSPEEVSFYVCGPTVYNYIHIGNARSVVAFDTIRRYLEYRGYKVNYIMNFTDVDDKIIRAAQEEGLTPNQLADKYIEAFRQDTSALNVQPATLHPRVTDHISQIIQFIEDLIAKGHAYESEGDVYFATETFPNYGALSQQSIKDLILGASERVDEKDTQRKRHPIDFVLWKRAKENEVSWDSPWGAGRPGWHIECSVMATEHLGHTIDIHGGGQDLEFPHHENEIAQSECHSGEVFANYWMHNGFVTLGADDEKMSKSLGNFILLRDVLKEEDPMVVRYLLSSVHYRRPLKYDQSAIDDARIHVARLREALRRLKHRQADAHDHLDTDQEWLRKLTVHLEDFKQGMDDDFNVANGLSALFALLKTINYYLNETDVSNVVLNEMSEHFNQLLSLFGLELSESDWLDEEIEQLIEERNQARSDRNYQRADEIRDLLKAQGILLDDTPQGTTWKREGLNG